MLRLVNGTIKTKEIIVY